MRSEKRAVAARQVRATGAEVEGLRCPVCGEGAIVVGHRAWGCARWKDGCRMVVPFEVAGKRVTDAQLRDLVQRGKTRAASFEVDGKMTRAALVFERTGRPPLVRVVPAPGRSPTVG